MSEVHVEDHSTAIRTPQQLIVVVLLAFLVPILSIVMIVQMVTGGLRVDSGSSSMSEDAVARRLKPVGDVALADATPATGSANQSGASFAQPAVSATRPAVAASPAAPGPAAVVSSTPAAKTALSAGRPDGNKVYQTVCAACHGAGLMGAPKPGDKAGWKQRLAQGLSTLHEHAIKGIRAMPAKGGNPSLSDPEVSAAVDYMLSQSK